MNDEKKKLNEVKALIKSLIVSSTRSLTVVDVCRDFRNEVGKDIPLFGHKDVWSFLNSISDTVVLRGNTVLPVTSEKSRHIEDLVSRQKPARARRESQFKYRESNYRFRGRSAGPSNGMRYGDSRRSYSGNNRPRILPEYPQAVRNYVSSNYSQTTKHVNNISSKSGSLHDVWPKEALSEISWATESTLQAQRQNDQKNNQCDTETNEFKKPENFFKFSQPNNPFKRDKSEEKKNVPISTLNSTPPNLPQPVKNDNLEPQILKTENRKLVRDKSEEKNNVLPLRQPVKTDNPVPEILKTENTKRGKQLIVTECFLNEKVKQKIGNIVNKFPNGIWGHEIPQEFNKVYGYTLEFSEYNYSDLPTMLLSIPDVIQCVETENHLWFVYPYYVDLPQECFIRKPAIPWDIKNKLRNLLLLPQYRETGIKQENIITAYEKYYMTVLRVQDYFCKDVEMFVKSLDGDVVQVIYVEPFQESYVFPLLDKPGEEFVGEPIEIVPEPLEVQPSLPIPVDALQFGERIPEPDLTTDVYIGMRLISNFADIIGPRAFYISIDRNKKPMMDYLEQMNDYYNNLDKDKYKMVSSTIQPQQYCACLHNEGVHDIWYRARIVKLKGETITVKLVDFGGLVETTADKLKFLFKKFTTYPVRIVLCRQAGIKPNGGTKYTRLAIERFSECLQQSRAEAHVLFIDHLYSYVLVDTFTPVISKTKIKKAIAHILIKEGHALPYAPEVSECFENNVLKREKEEATTSLPINNMTHSQLAIQKFKNLIISNKTTDQHQSDKREESCQMPEVIPKPINYVRPQSPQPNNITTTPVPSQSPFLSRSQVSYNALNPPTTQIAAPRTNAFPPQVSPTLAQSNANYPGVTPRTNAFPPQAPPTLPHSNANYPSVTPRTNAFPPQAPPTFPHSNANYPSVTPRTNAFPPQAPPTFPHSNANHQSITPSTNAFSPTLPPPNGIPRTNMTSSEITCLETLIRVIQTQYNITIQIDQPSGLQSQFSTIIDMILFNFIKQKLSKLEGFRQPQPTMRPPPGFQQPTVINKSYNFCLSNDIINLANLLIEENANVYCQDPLTRKLKAVNDVLQNVVSAFQKNLSANQQISEIPTQKECQQQPKLVNPEKVQDRASIKFATLIIREQKLHKILIDEKEYLWLDEVLNIYTAFSCLEDIEDILTTLGYHQQFEFLSMNRKENPDFFLEFDKYKYDILLHADAVSVVNLLKVEDIPKLFHVLCVRDE